MARLTSTPTTLTVTNLPAWLPAKGTWGQVSLAASVPGGRLDASVAGDFPNTPFRSNRNMGLGDGYSDDYIGAVWNPHWGTWGAWVIFGGGHAAGAKYGMLDSSVYIWEADSRVWKRLTDPTYPGDIPISPTWGFYDSAAQMPNEFEPLKTYGELTANVKDGYVPAASHVRWLPTIVPPGTWGTGPRGGLVIARQAAYHFGGNTVANQAHLFDFASRKWSRIGDIDSDTGAGATSDASGNIYKRGTGGIRKLAVNATSWSALGVAWASFGPWGPLAWVPGEDLLVALTNSSPNYSFQVIDLKGPTGVFQPGMSGTAPSIPGSGSYYPKTGFVWCPDLNGLVLLSPADFGVYLLAKPAKPLSQPWTWSKLSAANLPIAGSPLSAPGSSYYNRFQYSPVLKAFFISYDLTRDGMWCFRPAEIS